MTTHPLDANAWVVQLHARKLRARERAELNQWLAASPDNVREFLRAETVWRLSGGFAHDEQIQRQLDAILARKPPRPVVARRRSVRIVAWAASVLVIATLGALAWQMLAHNHATVYETVAGEQRSVLLPDESALTLNTASRVRVRYGEHERKLELERGEVIFQVAKDAARPFVVQVGPGIVRALGTRFDVMLDERRAVTVAVLDGSVQVITRGVGRESPSQPTNDASGAAAPAGSILRAGESAAFESSGRMVRANPEHASLERINAWHDGKLRFDAWSLLDAIREHNRYATKPIRFGSAELENLRVSGVFRVGDTAALLSALNQLLDIEAVDEGDSIVLNRSHRTEQATTPDSPKAPRDN